MCCQWWWTFLSPSFRIIILGQNSSNSFERGLNNGDKLHGLNWAVIFPTVFSRELTFPLWKAVCLLKLRLPAVGRPQDTFTLQKVRSITSFWRLLSPFFCKRWKSWHSFCPAVSEHKSVVKVVSADMANGASKKFEVIPRPWVVAGVQEVVRALGAECLQSHGLQPYVYL